MAKRKMGKRPVLTPPGPSTSYVQLSGGIWACFDTEDADTIAQHTWYWSPKVGPRTANRESPGGHIIMQRLLMGIVDVPKVYIVFRNGFKHDCRRANLFMADRFERIWVAKLSSRNTTGQKGLGGTNRAKSWSARSIEHGQTNLYLRFEDEAKAKAVLMNFHVQKRGECVAISASRSA